MDSPLDRYLADIIRAVDGGTPYSALALALAVPDICGVIERSAEGPVNDIAFGSTTGAACSKAK